MMVQGQVSEEPVVGEGGKRKPAWIIIICCECRVYIHLAKPTETGAVSGV